MAKKILITGENSYIGTYFDNWISDHYDNKYIIVRVGTRNEEWKKIDFSLYDVVLHVAGIAHITETTKNKATYYKVNRDLAYEIAKEAKAKQVKQFIFLSTMSVYGVKNGVIYKSTVPKPNTYYGKSKLEAEQLIMPLSNELFKVSIIRPPMVYGKGCKGNYTKIAKLAIKIPLFPKINNMRSMIYIDNLMEFLRCLIEDGSKGIFFPQNKEYVNTSEMVKLIATEHNKNIKLINFFNPIIKNLTNRNTTINKIFGSLVYDKTMSNYAKSYAKIDFKNTIIKTEDVYNESRK